MTILDEARAYLRKPDYKPEDERKPFEVRDYLDRPEVIEAYIGDLQVVIERLNAVLDQIEELAFQAQRSASDDQPPGNLADPVDPE